jgi:hypothetical protein
LLCYMLVCCCVGMQLCCNFYPGIILFIILISSDTNTRAT